MFARKNLHAHRPQRRAEPPYEPSLPFLSKLLNRRFN